MCTDWDDYGNCTGRQQGTLATAEYNQAGQLTNLNGGYNKWRSYNSLLQVTGAAAWYNTGYAMNMQYNYSGTQNNGRIVSSVDGVTGEQVSYTYDWLNRLATAATTGDR